VISGHTLLPTTCLGVTGCVDFDAAVAECDCKGSSYLDPDTTTCTECPTGQEKGALPDRTGADLTNWQGFNASLCVVVTQEVSQPPFDATVLLAVMGAIIGVLLLSAAAYGIKLFVAHYRRAIAAQRRAQELKLERLKSAASSVTTCGFVVCLMKYEAFRKNGKLVTHEEALYAGDLVMLHVYDDVLAFVSVYPTAFFSHQWLGFKTPDPNHVHFEAICQASESLCRQFSVATTELYVWVDYTSIPQRNPILKNLSIGSLGVYASVCKFFVVVAPETLHTDTSVPCTPATYQKRGWCRLEQWARISVGGLKNMYVFEAGGALTPISDKPSWYRDSNHVFDGEFTVDADKIKLVDTVLGLYAHALRFEDNDSKIIQKLVLENKASVFPPQYFDDLVELLEQNISSMSLDGAMLVKSDSLPIELAPLEKADMPVLRGSHLKAIFQAVDTDGDGKISATEMASAPPQLRDQLAAHSLEC